MKYLIQLLLVSLTASLFSCESLVTTIPESKLPKGTEKIAMHAYISPQDTVILVKLTTSTPLLGVYRNNGYGFAIVGQDTIYYTGASITNAKVVLSNSKKQSIEIPYNKANVVYMLDARKFPIVAGETYTLTAEAALGKVEATCTVPKETAAITNYKIDTLASNSLNMMYPIFYINFDWKDIAGQSNYYSMKASVLARMLLTPVGNDRKPDTIIKTLKYTGYWDQENRQEQYQSDANRDGQVFSTPNGIISIGTEAVYENDFLYSTRFLGGKSTISLEVLNTDQNYYNYHRAVRINNRQDGNPFVEPVPIPTNVKNGLGCFAASNRSILTIVY